MYKPRKPLDSTYGPGRPAPGAGTSVPRPPLKPSFGPPGRGGVRDQLIGRFVGRYGPTVKPLRPRRPRRVGNQE